MILKLILDNFMTSVTCR